MGDFFAELKRRHIYRVAAAYAVVAWVVIQLVNNVTPMLNLPNVVGTAVFVLLAAGFPIAVFFAWVMHLASAEGANASIGRLDWFLAGALVVVIALVSYQQFGPGTGSGAQQQASLAPAAPKTAPQGISVVVLPFANMSGDASQEFFSDGITEEITSALAKVPDLRVVGRTSAFQFKGENKDLRAIGQSLSATHLIEGSVRKEGNEIRITAQLIRADDGTHLWTESYNRELRGVFAVQEEIAQSIATALQVPLGLKQGETLVSNRTADTDSYQNYLRAKALVRARGAKALTDAAALLEQVVARDTNYAPAWALLATAYLLRPDYSPAGFGGDADVLRAFIGPLLPKAEAAARRSTELDAKFADGFTTLAIAQHARGNSIAADDLYKQALALDPDNSDTLHFYSLLLAETGHLKESLVMRQRLAVLEPFVPVFNWNNATLIWLSGQTDAALAILQSLPPDAPMYGKVTLAAIYAAAGRYSEAAGIVDALPPEALPKGTTQTAARLLRAAPAKAASPQTLPRLGMLSWIFLYAGAPGRVVEYFESNVEAGFNFGLSVHQVWHSNFAPVRRTAQFKAFVRKAGYVNYWRARGWPDLCHPTTGDDFECN